MKYKSIALILVFTLCISLIAPFNIVFAAGEGNLGFFEDHFNRSYINGNWEIIDGVWSVSSGKLTAAKGHGYKALVKGHEFHDFSIEGDICLADRDGDAGFVLRCIGASPGADNIQGYYVGISAQGTGSVFLGVMNNNWKELNRKTVAINPDTTYRLKVTAEGNLISIYVNDILAFQYTDTAYVSGQVGIRMYNSNPAFDNIIVTNNENVTVFTEDFEVLPQDQNIGNWNIIDGDWSLQLGTLAVEAGDGHKVIAKDVAFQDFTVETDIKITSSSPIGNAGILFRTQGAEPGADNVRGYYAGLGLDGKITFGRMNNDFTDLEIIKILDSVDPNKFYRLKVVTRGNIIKLYLNDMHKPVVVHTDESADKYLSGGIGLRTWQSDVIFDNFIASEYVSPVEEFKEPIKNRDPLLQTPFIPLPLGSVEAEGWLLKQLELMKDGITGYSEDLYYELGNNSEWLGGTAPDSNWERPVYYVKGLVALAYTLKDPDLIAKSQKWINWMLESQREDGYFGPVSSDDWWPRMVAVYALKDYYEATGDERVIEHLTKYFQYQLDNLDIRPLRDWGKIRFGDNMNVVLWLYNRTGDQFLLELAHKLNAQGYDITDVLTNNNFLEAARNDSGDFYTQHTVNVNQSIKNPAIYYQLSGNAADRDAYVHGVEHLDKYHNQITGINAGTEMLSGLASTQGVELCATAERIHSNSVTAMITGNPVIGDLQEKVAFNSLPASMSRDIKTHQYYTLPNQVESGIVLHGFKQDYHTGAMQSITSGFPCCRFNLHMAWPYFVKEMWAATEDGGLGIVAYGPSKVSTKIQGEEIVIKEETNYPFEDEIKFTIERATLDIQFPLKLRIPAWTKDATVTVNGVAQTGVQSGEYYVINRKWAEGDIVELKFPMEIEASTWINNSVGIERGPLVYSLKIEEEWEEESNPAPHVSEPGFKQYNIRAKTPWNYGLMIDRENPESCIEVITRELPKNTNPFTQAATPVELIAKGKIIPSWGRAPNSIHSAEPPVGPVYSGGEIIDITLVPFGSENLRITYFPEVTDDQSYIPAKYEAEDAQINRAQVRTNNIYASGHSYVGGIDFDDSYVDFDQINVAESGTYRVYIWYASNTNNFSPATAKIIVNDNQEQSIPLAGTIGWGRFMATSTEVYLNEGFNSIKFMRGTGYNPGFYELDYISIAPIGGKGVPVVVPVEDIIVRGENGATTITTNRGTLQLTAEIMPENATNKNVTWLVEDGTGSASINQSGLLTALSDGTVIVKAIAKDGSGIFGSLEITISGQTLLQGTAVLTGKKSVEIGEIFNLNYALSNFTDDDFKPVYAQVYAQDITVNFDAACLEFKGAESMRGEQLIVSTNEIETGKIRILLTSKDVGLDTNGDWLQLSFGVRATESLNTVITLSNIVIENEAGDEHFVGDTFHSLSILEPGAPMVPVESITVRGKDGATTIATRGGTLQLAAEVLPENATNKEVIWSIESGLAYAAVSSTGLVTAKANGKVVVKAASASNSNIFGTYEIVITGQSSGGSGGTSPVATPSTPWIQEGNIIKVSNVKPDSKGNATVKVDSFILQKLVDAVQGNSINISATLTEKAKKVLVKLPTKKLRDAKQKGIESISVDLGYASFTFEPALLIEGPEIADELELSVTKIDSDKLPDSVRVEVGDCPAYDFAVKMNGNYITAFGHSKIYFTLDYGLKQGEDLSNVIAYAINNNGELEIIKNSRYNMQTGKLGFKVTHPGKFAVAYRKVSFRDLTNVTWAKQSIEALAARDIVKGSNNNLFVPNVSVTRAEFIMMLINAFDLSVDNAESSFKDAKKGAWYYDAIASAQALGITKGRPDGSFGINETITREDMAVMTHRASQIANVNLAAEKEAKDFADATQIASYAADSVAVMQRAGVINGFNNIFAPKNNATRAEAAVIIYSLYKLTD